MGEGIRNLGAARLAVLGALAAIAAGGVAAVGCSSNGSSGGDNGVDASDASDDGATGADSTMPDAGGDATSGADGDAGAPDSNTHDASDSGAAGDASDGAPGSDASDGAPGEASVDGGGSCQVFDASGLDEAAVSAGFQQVFTVYKCFNCHQDKTVHPVDDAGNGIVLSGNNAGLSATAFPPNLTNDPTGLGCWTNDQVQNAILNGQDPEGGALCPPMPVFGHGTSPGRPMDAGTAQEIIAYLRSLPPVANQVPDTTCPAPLDGGADADAGIADAAIVDAGDGGG